jgi:hypothetical protein
MKIENIYLAVNKECKSNYLLIIVTPLLTKFQRFTKFRFEAACGYMVIELCYQMLKAVQSLHSCSFFDLTLTFDNIYLLDGQAILPLPNLQI